MKIAIINRFGLDIVDYTKFFNNDVEVVIFSFKETKKPYCGRIYYYRGLDKSFYVDLFNEHSKKSFDFLVTTSEYDVELAGDIREYLGIPGMKYNQSILFRDKYLMKSFFQKVVSVPIFSKVERWSDILQFAENNGYPFVIKPRLEAGSEGVGIIKDANDLHKYLSNIEFNGLMLEEYINGDMYHVDGFYQDSRIIFSTVSKYVNGCLSFKNAEFLGSVMINNKEEIDSLNVIVKHMLDSVNYHENGIMFHAEFFKTDNKFVLCEIGSRMGGAKVREVIKYVSGNDLLDKHILSQAGTKISFSGKSEKIAGWMLIPQQGGILKNVEIATFDWVVDSFFDNKLIGKEFSPADSSDCCYISYIVKGENEEEICQRMAFLSKWQRENTVWE